MSCYLTPSVKTLHVPTVTLKHICLENNDRHHAPSLCWKAFYYYYYDCYYYYHHHHCLDRMFRGCGNIYCGLYSVHTHLAGTKHRWSNNPVNYYYSVDGYLLV